MGARGARVEEEPGANGSYWWSLGLLSGAAAVAGVAARRGGFFGRALGVAVGAGAAYLAAQELPPGRRLFRRSVLPHRTAHHVLAEIGPEDAERTVIVMAHHDAAHTAFFFNPAITEAVGERYPQVFEDNDTSPPLMWPMVGAPALVAAGAAVGSRKLAGLGAFLSAGGAAFMAHIGASEVVPGANDNGTGCIAQIALAKALAEDPPERTCVLFLSTSEEALCEGMGLFMERHAAELPTESTFFLCLDTVGSPHLLALRGEGMLGMQEYPARSLELVDSIADEIGIEMPFRNLRTQNATDGIFPVAAGYECVSIASVNQFKNPSNYHWKTDTPENVDYGTVTDAIRLSEAVIRKLDARWFGE